MASNKQRENAETIALQALAFLASDTERLEHFMGNTGLTPQDLSERASETDMLVSVLDALLADESALLMFATERAVEPEAIYPARMILSGTYDVST